MSPASLDQLDLPIEKKLRLEYLCQHFYKDRKYYWEICKIVRSLRSDFAAVARVVRERQVQRLLELVHENEACSIELGYLVELSFHPERRNLLELEQGLIARALRDYGKGFSSLELPPHFVHGEAAQDYAAFLERSNTLSSLSLNARYYEKSQSMNDADTIYHIFSALVRNPHSQLSELCFQRIQVVCDGDNKTVQDAYNCLTESTRLLPLTKVSCKYCEPNLALAVLRGLCRNSTLRELELFQSWVAPLPTMSMPGKDCCRKLSDWMKSLKQPLLVKAVCDLIHNSNTLVKLNLDGFRGKELGRIALAMSHSLSIESISADMFGAIENDTLSDFARNANRYATSLKEISFHGSAFCHFSPKVFLLLLDGNTHLTHLSFRNFVLSDEHATTFFTMLAKNKALKSVVISFQDIRDETMLRLVEALCLHPSLQTLNLSVDSTFTAHGNVTKSVTRILCDALKHSRIESVILKGFANDRESIGCLLGAVASSRAISSLRLLSTLSAEGRQELCQQLPKLNKLRCLAFSALPEDTGFWDSFVAALALQHNLLSLFINRVPLDRQREIAFRIWSNRIQVLSRLPRGLLAYAMRGRDKSDLFHMVCKILPYES